MTVYERTGVTAPVAALVLAVVLAAVSYGFLYIAGCGPAPCGEEIATSTGASKCINDGGSTP